LPAGEPFAALEAEWQRSAPRQQPTARPLAPVDVPLTALQRTFDARHLRLEPYAIHLATGRVTRDGEPIEFDLPKDVKRFARPWLPYDEKLLERIYWTAIEIAVRVSGA
jgi:hypothetical protein